MSGHARAFFKQCNGLKYVYDNGYWFKIEFKEVRSTPRRPAGIKYSLALFDEKGTCLVRFDNGHGVKARGRRNPVAFDHWHRFSDGALIPYAFVDEETLVSDFFQAVDALLPPELRSG